MALLAETYLKVFKQQLKGFYGYRNTEIHQIQYLPTTRELHSGCLYIAKDGTPAPSNPTICVFLTNPSDLDELYRRAQNLLISDYRRNSSLTLLNNTILQDGSLDELVCIVHSIMENPVRFISAAYKTITCSKKQMGNFHFPSLRSGIDLYNNQIFLLEADDTNPSRRIVGRSCYKGTIVGYILVEETENPFCLSIDIRYMRLLLDIYATQIYQNQTSSDTAELLFIRNLLQGTLTDPTEIRCKLNQLKFPQSEKYHLLAIDRSTNYSLTVKEKLKALLKQEIYTYDNYYLAILEFEWNQEFHAENYPKLAQYLSSENLKAGISYGFFDYSNLRTAFEQCTKTIAICKNSQKELTLARYEDFMIAHLLEVADNCGIPVTSLCHPTCIKIYEYDQENGTCFLDTLAAYILNGANLQAAAQKLFVHRNTVYHRIDTLKEKFNLNLDDPRMFTKLQISVRIFTYLNIRNFSSYIGTSFEEN